MEQITLKSERDFGVFMKFAISMIILTVIFAIYFFPINVITSVSILAAGILLVARPISSDIYFGDLTS